MIVFKTNKIFLNEEYLNFFNDAASMRLDLPAVNGKNDNPNRVAISMDQRVAVACYNLMGSYIIDISNPIRPIFASYIKGSDSHDGVTFLK